MALPNGAGGYQVGAGNRQETIMGAMAAPQTATATATLTAAQIVNQMLVANPGSSSAATYTLPTGALIDAAVPNATVGSTFDLSIVNIGTSSGTVTLAVSTGVTDGGNALVAVAVTTSQLFRFRKTGDGTYVVYRLG
jgi:N-methylhydantoinase B/oxoprolinase/acetone carboxylase alpha subunit